jgi:putative hydrolase of the HAD superfamily
MKKYCIFDLDNTLYDYDTAHSNASEELNRYLSNILEVDFLSIKGLLNQAKELSKKLSQNTAESHSRIIYIAQLFIILGLKPDPIKLLESENLYWSTFISRITLFDYVDEFLFDLKSRGANLILVTDMSTRIQLRKLIALGLDNVFDTIISSDMVGGDKITGKPFRYLEETLIKTREPRWYFGDKDWDFNLDDQGEYNLRFKKSLIDQKIFRLDTEILEFSDYRVLGAAIENLW